MLSFTKVDRGFESLRNPNPRFFEFEPRLARFCPTITEKKEADKIIEELTNIFDEDWEEETVDSKFTKISNKINIANKLATKEKPKEQEETNEENECDSKSIDEEDATALKVFYSTIQTLKFKEKLLKQLKRNADKAEESENDFPLLGPSKDYKPQTEKSTEKSIVEPMNVTKALTSLNLVNARGMDNGGEGAQILSNQLSVQVHDLEQKRVDYFKTTDKLKREKENNIKAFKGQLCFTVDQLEKEKNDIKWETAKVREDLCAAHEAFQFFRNKYKGWKVNDTELSTLLQMFLKTNGTKPAKKPERQRKLLTKIIQCFIGRNLDLWIQEEKRDCQGGHSSL